VTSRALPDDLHRTAAIRERERNVLVDAGAGTGKTTLLVERLVFMVAPEDDGPARELSRLAAITFTRKAAGELRLRIREKLLAELARPGLTRLRRERLAAAAGAADTALVSTIHAFADRLLRMRPIEARLSPTYEIVEDEAALAAETCRALLHASQAGTLAAELDGRLAPDRADEAAATIRDAIAAGVLLESKEYEHHTLRGLDALVARWIATRDVPPPDAPAAAFDLAAFRRYAAELRERVAGVAGRGDGGRWLLRLAGKIAALEDEARPALILAGLNACLRGAPKDVAGKAAVFDGDEAAWDAWHAWIGKERKRNPVRASALRDDLLAPLRRWLATRLVRAAPAALALYEAEKTRRKAVDQVDLLLRLRDLLRDHPDARRFYQGQLDHVFVDEFQDTDPLQAEIVLFLCERGVNATSWREVTVAPGKLTLVGDPKQSIYRFRRADIAVYDEVRSIVSRGPHLVAPLTTNFRSAPGLIAWVNDRFDAILGEAKPGVPPFDAAAGRVRNERLVAGRGGAAGAKVTVLPLGGEGAKADEHRAIEARAVAAWLRTAVGRGDLEVVDPVTKQARPARFGDVAILAASTWHLHLLFDALDAAGVPHAARGGSLFLSDPLHRRFLLALRGIADRRDGPAQAALFGPPFFAIGDADLVRARVHGDGPAGAAHALVDELRRERFARTPGATARELLERSALARTVALGPNGAQRLARLRELCLETERMAAGEGLDFDAVTARLREWAEAPVALDPPRPAGGAAVSILTIHQAKGLEWPVVVLWDGRACWEARGKGAAWVVAPRAEGTAWAIDLAGLAWEEPAGAEILDRERSFLDAERERLVYVAATRARDRLVVPLAGDARPDRINGRLVLGAPSELVDAVEPFSPEAPPAWAGDLTPVAPRDPVPAPLSEEVGRAWQAAAEAAARPRFSPGAVSGEAHAVPRAPAAPPSEHGDAVPAKRRPSRFGPTFGDTVHRAIGLALADAALAPGAAVARAAGETGLREHLEDAAADVRRALDALEAEGLRSAPGPALRLEYPVAHAAGGKLLTGYVDLLAVRDGRPVVLDFKTDAPPLDEPVETSHASYVEQVRSYARILEALAVAPPGTVRCGLLFTAEGRVRWIPR
jgi:ATP-dependent exoDNAse (exonuclease V) beta subunit